MSHEITWGCGDFLPGEGPFNFLDLDTGGSVQGPLPPFPPWVGPEIIIEEDDPPTWRQGPPTPFPTYPNDIIIVRNDPFNTWQNPNWLPDVGWSSKWEIEDIIIKTATGSTPTHGGTAYAPSFDNYDGSITLPSIPERTWDNGPPKTLTVNLLWNDLGNAFPPVSVSNTYTLLTGNQGGITIGGSPPGSRVRDRYAISDPANTGGPTIGGGGTQSDPTQGGTVVPTITEYGTLNAVEVFQGTGSPSTHSAGATVSTIKPVVWLPGTKIMFVNVVSENYHTPSPFIVNSFPYIYANPAANYDSVGYTFQSVTTPRVYNASINQGGGLWGAGAGTKVEWNESNGEFYLYSISELFVTLTAQGPPTGLEIVTRSPHWELVTDPITNITAPNIPDREWTIPLIAIYPTDSGGINEGSTGPPDFPGFTIGGGPSREQLPPQRKARRSRKIKEVSSEEIISNARKVDKINLNDPAIIASITSDYPTGLQDFDTAYSITPTLGKMVSNTTGSSDLLSNRIDKNLAYIINNNEQIKNWDSTKPGGVNTRAVLRSLTPEALSLISKIRNYDGTPLNDSQKYALVGSRAMDGTLGNINYSLLNKLVTDSDKVENSNFDIIPSTSMIVNEVAALAYIESNYFSLDPEKSGGLMRRILPNWKVFATDVDKHIEIRIANGTLKKFYVKDDNTLVDRSSIKVQDGDFVEVKVGGVLKRFFCKSEIDHSFMMPERVRMKAVTLLGGDSSRTLSVSADVSDGIEFNYSLSSPRQNFYVLSAVLSSTVTQPTHQGSYLLKDTTLTYELMDTSSAEGLSSVNDYIQYKANSLTYILDDDDRMLDYIETTGKLEVRQTDILTDSPKTIKSTPLLTRQIPWYIIVYPTNRPEYNVFNAKSFIGSYESSGITSRYIRTAPSTAAEFNRPNFNIFVPQIIASTKSLEYPDAAGDYSLQTRVAKISAEDAVYQTGYRKDVGGEIGSAQTVNPPKLKTTFRVVKEIITELNNNYILEWDSLGRTLTTFDVISRLNLKQFSKFISIENYALLFPLIKKGIIDNVKVFEPTRGSSVRLTDKKTQLVMRRSNAGEDTFPPIMAMPTGYVIDPPTTAGPTFGPVVRQPITPA